jgi:septal ring factor EnvC (AmiA/AmiB activator)
MALKFEIDAEAFEALDEGQQNLYSKYGEKYRLEVEGIDPADELKEALRKEREERAAAKSKLTEYEKQQQEAEEKRLAEKQEFEKLWKQEQEQRNKTTQELEELRHSIAQEKRKGEASKIANGLATETARAELLTKEAMGFVHHTPEGIKINGPEGEAWDAHKLTAYLKERYPFLVDGSKASGGGATGGANGSGATGKKFNELSSSELKAIKDDDPAAYERLKTEYYGK